MELDIKKFNIGYLDAVITKSEFLISPLGLSRLSQVLPQNMRIIYLKYFHTNHICHMCSDENKAEIIQVLYRKQFENVE